MHKGEKCEGSGETGRIKEKVGRKIFVQGEPASGTMQHTRRGAVPYVIRQ